MNHCQIKRDHLDGVGADRQQNIETCVQRQTCGYGDPDKPPYQDRASEKVLNNHNQDRSRHGQTGSVRMTSAGRLV